MYGERSTSTPKAWRKGARRLSTVSQKEATVTTVPAMREATKIVISTPSGREMRARSCLRRLRGIGAGVVSARPPGLLLFSRSVGRPPLHRTRRERLRRIRCRYRRALNRRRSLGRMRSPHPKGQRLLLQRKWPRPNLSFLLQLRRPHQRRPQYSQHVFSWFEPAVYRSSKLTTTTDGAPNSNHLGSSRGLDRDHFSSTSR
jgi:hypothetical protein